MLRPIAFIFLSPGASPTRCTGVFTTDVHEMTVVGCNDIDNACAVAAKLAEDGAKLIELCGGFGEDGCRRVISAVGGRIPVGYVTLFPEEAEKLKKQRATQ